MHNFARIAYASYLVVNLVLASEIAHDGVALIQHKAVCVHYCGQLLERVAAACACVLVYFYAKTK